MHEAPLRSPPTPAAAREARRARRDRVRTRLVQASATKPELRLDRSTPILALLRSYREHGAPAGAGTPGALEAYVRVVEREVSHLEAATERLPRSAHRDGEAIRRALCFLRGFGRIGALDFQVIPVEERGHLVLLLAAEYRWCFAAAGTTARAFKLAIGRTGAR